jgi:hypothetical protein
MTPPRKIKFHRKIKGYIARHIRQYLILLIISVLIFIGAFFLGIKFCYYYGNICKVIGEQIKIGPSYW